MSFAPNGQRLSHSSLTSETYELRNTAVKHIVHVRTSRPNWRSDFLFITLNESKSEAWAGILNACNFFGKAQNKMVNQQNTGDLINFVSVKS